MTFLAWLKQQKRRDDPVGDLARDVLQDRERPSRSQSYSAWKQHLEDCDACEAALSALHRAFAEFRSLV